MKTIQKYAWAIWLGGSLAAIGYPFTSWQYWFVIVPINFLVLWRIEGER